MHPVVLPHPLEQPRTDCTGSVVGASVSDHFSSPPPNLFLLLLAEESLSLYSDQTSYLSICLEDHSRLQVEHFSQEELKKKVIIVCCCSVFSDCRPLGSPSEVLEALSCPVIPCLSPLGFLLLRSPEWACPPLPMSCAFLLRLQGQPGFHCAGLT